MKVPLGRKFRPVVTEDQHFSPERLVQDLRAKGCEVRPVLHASPWKSCSPYAHTVCTLTTKNFESLLKNILKCQKHSSKQ